MRTIERGGKTYYYLRSEVVVMPNGQQWIRHRFYLPGMKLKDAHHAFEFELIPDDVQIVPEMTGGFA